jgi:hypothetical protein
MNTGIPDSSHFENEMSVKAIAFSIQSTILYLVSKWYWIVLVSCIGGLVGLFYSHLNKPSYIATTTFVLEESSGSVNSLGSLAGLASIAGFDVSTGGGIFQGDNILELYKSRSMIQQTLLKNVSVNNRKVQLVDLYIEANKLRESWKDDTLLRNIAFQSSKNKQLTRIQDSLIGLFVIDIKKRYLIVEKPDKKLSIISATITSEDEKFSRIFNEQLVKNVNDFYIQTKTRKLLGNVSILQHKADSVKNVMNGAIYSSVAVTDATPNLNPTRLVQRVAPMQRAQINAETNKAVLSELVKNLELTKMSLLEETPLIQVIDVPIYPLEKIKVSYKKGAFLGGFIAALIFMFVLLTRRLFIKLMI